MIPLMEDGQHGLNGALVNQIVERVEIEPVTLQLLFLVELNVLDTIPGSIPFLVMGVTVALVKDIENLKQGTTYIFNCRLI